MNKQKWLRLCSFILAVGLTLGTLTGCKKDEDTPLNNDLGVDMMPVLTDNIPDDTTAEESTSEVTEPIEEVSSELETTTESEQTTTESQTEQTTTQKTEETTESEQTTSESITTTTSETTPVVTMAPITTAETTISQVAQTTVTTSENSTINVVKPTKFTGELQDLSTTLNVITSMSKAYWYDQLTDKEANAYNKLLSAALKYRATVEFDTALTSEEYNRVFVLLYNQNPELFWLSGKTALASDGMSATLFYIYNEATADSMQVKLNKRVKELLDMMSADMTDLEKVLLCHDYIVKYNTYSNDTKNSSNAYGCIIEGKSQCSGYAKGMLYMCDQLQIPCIYVNGVSGETGNTHAWNQIYLEGAWYNVDVMWDDPYMEPEDKKNVSYRYMGVPSVEIMDITHLDANRSQNKEFTYFDLPECNSTAQNADILYGYYANSYEEIYEKLKQGCLDAVENGRYCAHVKVKDKDVYLDALDRLFAQKEVYNIRKVINAQYGDGYVVSFSAAPENEMNYIEVTMVYGEGFEP